MRNIELKIIAALVLAGVIALVVGYFQTNGFTNSPGSPVHQSSSITNTTTPPQTTTTAADTSTPTPTVSQPVSPLSFIESEAKDLASKLKEVCSSTTEAVGYIPTTGAILVVWADSGMVEMDIQTLFVDSAQPQSEDEIVFVAGITRHDTQTDDTYVDGQPGIRIDYTVKLFFYEGSKLIIESTFIGLDPPMYKNVFGPGYGEPPDEKVAWWLGEQINTRVRGALGIHDDEVESLTFSPDGKMLASCSLDDTVRLWDIESGLNITVFHEYLGTNYSVAFSPDGKLLASADWGVEFIVWNPITMKKITTITDYENAGYLAFSPDGTILATADYGGGEVSLWDTSTFEKLYTLDYDINPSFIAFSPNGKTLVYSDWEELIIWDIALNKPSHTLFIENYYPESVSFSPDSQTLAVGYYNSKIGKVLLWDIVSGQNIDTIIHTDNGAVYNVAFSPYGTKLVSSGSSLKGHDSTVYIWDVATKQILTTINHNNIITFAWSPNGNYIAFAGKDCLVWLWDVAANKLAEWP